MWIKFGKDHFNTDLIAVVRPVGDDGDQCIIFLSGSSPMDGGFLVDMPHDDVMEALRMARLSEIQSMLEDEINEHRRRG